MAYSDNWNDLISTFGYGFVDDLKQYNHIVKVGRILTCSQCRLGNMFL